MGKVSVKENKSVYQLCREEAGFTREKAAEKTYLTPERIEKIENGKVAIYPDDVTAMAEGYNAPYLCNHYCSKECPIGMKYVPEIPVQDLRQIVLEMLASLNSMRKRQERLIEVSVDNQINPDEVDDFVEIQAELEKMSILVESLQLWSEQMISDGRIDIDAYNRAKEKHGLK